MPLIDKQRDLLISYRDKSYVSAILFEEHSNYYAFINNIFTIPIILISSAMTVINSSFHPDDMKIVNIILNASTSLILSLMGNFKFNDRSNNFKNAHRKMNALCHSIEDFIFNELEEEPNIEIIRGFIKTYDTINDSIDYPLSSRIKEKVRIKYKEKKVLPNSLNCINGSSEIIYGRSSSNATSPTIHL